MNSHTRTIVQEERAQDLYAEEVFGVSLWRLIRVPVIEAHMAARHARGPSNQNRVPLTRITHIAAGIVRSVCHLPRLRRRRFLVMGFPRRRLENGEWVDPFSDPIIDMLGADQVLCVEKPFMGEHSRPPRTRGIVYFDWVTALSLVISQIGFFVPLIIFRGEISDLAFKAHHVTGISRRRISLLAAKATVRFWFERLVARALLSIVRPQAVLLTIRRHHYPLIHVCRIRGIPIYELQHGAIAEGGYKYSTPYDAKLDPDAFFTFGEYWNLAEWGLPAEAVEPVGFKYILDRRARFPGGAARRGSKVMLVSQPHISRALGAVFGTVVKHRPDVQFILKLHPQDVDRWWERYPCGREMNVQVPVEPSSDLYALFAECRCVIGYDSTVLFEASFFGLAVGILNLDGRNRCSALEFDGRYNFHEIRDPGQIDDLLGAEQSSCEYDANPFFAAFDKARFQRLMGIVA